MHGANGVVVNSATRLLSNGTHFAEHTKAVAEHADFASLVVVPAHGHFAQPQTGFECEIEKFDVEAEAIDSRCFDERAANRHVEGFEAALRVPERQACRETHDEIKDASALFASPRLVDAD